MMIMTMATMTTSAKKKGEACSLLLELRHFPPLAEDTNRPKIKTKFKTKNVPSATDDDNDDDDIAQEERRSIFSAPCVAPFSTVSRRHKQTQNKKDKRRMCLVPHMMKTT